MIYEFSGFELDTELFALFRGGQTTSLRPKAYWLLLYLLENRHRVVSKQALCEAAWPGRVISDATLESTVMAVRRALGDTAQSHRFIQTLHGHGYRFVAEVAQKSVASTEADRRERRRGWFPPDFSSHAINPARRKCTNQPYNPPPGVRSDFSSAHRPLL